MDLGLAGKTALVLGATRGLGRGIGEMLHAEGAKVVFVGRDEARLNEITAALPGAGAVGADISAPGAADDIVAHAKAQLGQIDILVNNSGGPPPTPALGVDQALWRSSFEAMILPLLRIADLVVPDMIARGWGRVLTIASSGVVQPIPNLGVSNTLRSSIVGWSKTLSAEVADKGVTVNVLLPGRIDTDRVRSLDQSAADRRGVSADAAKDAAVSTIPAGRYGTVEEFAAAAVFLASRQAAYITGQCLAVDGGLIKSV